MGKRELPIFSSVPVSSVPLRKKGGNRWNGGLNAPRSWFRSSLVPEPRIPMGTDGNRCRHMRPAQPPENTPNAVGGRTRWRHAAAAEQAYGRTAENEVYPWARTAESQGSRLLSNVMVRANRAKAASRVAAMNETAPTMPPGAIASPGTDLHHCRAFPPASTDPEVSP